MLEIPKLPECVDNTAKNLADKPSQAIGQTISDLWDLILGSRVSFAAQKKKIKYAHDLEEFRKSLEAEVKSIPVEKLVEPSMQIAAQSLVDSQYCIESEELREMFSKLIARSMHADYSENIHPSFSKIAQQLSPFDAHMLKLFYLFRNNDGIAIVDYVRYIDTGGFLPMLECIPEVMPDNCAPDIAARSISSLQRLGLIEIPPRLQIMNPARYDVFRKTALFSDLQEQASHMAGRFDLIHRVGKLTVLGRLFVSVCLD